MSQHDLTIANQGFPAFRADLNSALQALGSCQSGTSAPSPTFANQLWYDTTNNILKIRNEDNDAWISVVTLDQTTDAVTAIGSLTLADIVSLTGSQTLTNKTLTNPVINGFTGDTSVVNIGSGQIYKDTSGNVGFNTTPSAWSSLKGIDISVGAGIAGGFNVNYLTGNAYFNGSNWIYKANGGAGLKETASSHKMLSADSGSAGGAITFTQVMDIQKDYSLALQGATIKAGTGITFPASQSASSDANTLDDYEEGTWTPIQGANITVIGTYSSNGTYTKIGNVVTIYGRLEGSTSIAAAAVGIICTGAPFTAKSAVIGTGGVFNATQTSNGVGFVNQSTATMYSVNSITSSNQIYFSCTYTIA